MEAEQWIQKKLPAYAGDFPEYKKMAETITLHQLIQAVYREGIVEAKWQNHSKTLVLFVEDGKLLVPISHHYILHHIDIDGDIIHVNQAKTRTNVDSLEKCLPLLFPGNNAAGFLREVWNSVTNLAMALTVAAYRKATLNDTAADVLAYASKQKSPLSFFEQWVIQGHSLHPCSRTRLGLSTEDVTAYAPEWEGRPKILPLLVHKERYHMTSRDGESPKSILFHEYPYIKSAYIEACLKNDVDGEDYDIIPIHPWQWEHTIAKFYKTALKEKSLIPLTEAVIPSSALISFRTLAPADSRAKSHIKTAVNVQMTSAVRTVSAASTKNGPVLSRLFKKILHHDDSLRSSLEVMGERAGIHYVPVQEEERVFLEKNAAAILRENPEQSLDRDVVAIPAASLIAQSPFSEKLIVEELAERYPSLEAFIYDYAKAVLPGVLTLMTKYGISMEAHLQNCVVLFKKEKPEKVILRDYGGIRVMKDRLNRFGQSTIDPSTHILAKSRSELVDVFSHALFHNHFGEIIVALARRTTVNEEVLWEQVEKVIEETYQGLKKDPLIPAGSLQDKGEILRKPTKMKALVKMRLSDQYMENLYVELPRPFTTRSEVNEDDFAND